ncbi:hypothetical protein M9H77_01549 [Catharanthus roseus]|uniref:Uncharacterized protein n=1 Tax=Catharanthus roseus TaxID=4058 RepID=A0ACC0C642_CATRO|nr:hypothetical protein M9H77_01549 [Catharanthus roseus]
MSINMVLPHFASQNGYAPISFRMQWHCLGCGVMDSSKFVVATPFKHGKGTVHGLMYSDGKMLCEVPKSYRSIYQGHRLSALAKSDIPVIQTAKKVFTYRFRTETGDQLKVLVEKNNDKYRVQVEVLSSQFSRTRGELVMSWGIFRSDSSCFMPLDFQESGLNGKYNSIETPLMQASLGTLVAELEYESSLAPFYISFLLKSHSGSTSKSSEIKSHMKKSFVVPVGFGSGKPTPLGFSTLADGTMNFALFSRSAESVVLCLYDDIITDKPALEIELDPYVNRSCDIWHMSMESNSSFVRYGYRCKAGGDGKQEHVLLDPYAKVIGNVVTSQSSSVLKGLGELCKEPPFDWGQDVRPSILLEELIVYRLNVIGFTKDKSSKLPNQIAGTFSGISEKLLHFKDLGVNAVLLEPIFPFDEWRGPYFPWHFFSPGIPFGSSGNTLSVIKSMKEMVKKLHSSGIEVFLEVVFTHTAENGALKEIDNSSYYIVKAGNALASKNALNCNFPIVTQMILDSLRHWVIEFHIDGFCFINAASLMRGSHGEFLSRPPLLEAIAFDPLLSKVKIIADSWDPYDKESKEILFPHWKRWAEVNSKFCYDVRNFLRGKGLLSSLATRLCGSGDIFLDGRGPSFSFNYITRNFGLSLVDLVSFSRTELASELSWNCGEEGPTNKASVLETRLKQIRNFLFILFISQGVPVLNMGDECGQSSGGSPAYDDRKPLNWNTLSTSFGIQITQFISFLSSLRVRRRDLLQKRNFLKEESIEWYGKNLSLPRWDDISSKFLGMILKASSAEDGDLFVVLNGTNHKETIVLPPTPVDMVWSRLVDTSLSFPGFFSADGIPVDDVSGTYEMKSHSCVLFEARSPTS